MECCGADAIHERELQRFCRVCASIIKGYKHTWSSCTSLLGHLGIDIASDKSEVHPLYYSHTCHNITKRLERGYGAESTLQAHTWSPHGFNCKVCCFSSPLYSVGRKRKGTKKRGRPSRESNKAIANSVLSSTPGS